MKSSTSKAAVEPLPEIEATPSNGSHGTLVAVAVPSAESRPSDIWKWLWLLWERRRFLVRVVVWGAVTSAMIAMILPKRYESSARLMPPDSKSGSGLAMLAAMAGKGGGLGLNSLAGDLLGGMGNGELFVDMLQSRTVEDRIVDRFNLRKLYDKKYQIDARKRLAANTEVLQDRKSEVITITVSDRDPQRAAQMAQAYVDELDRLVAQVSTSSARRERVFIEERLKGVKHDLDQASQQFSQYASQNTALDITVQAKAMVEGAAKLQGELIAAQSQMGGLEQIYTPNNIRVRSLRARIEELQKQLQKLGGTSAMPNVASATTPSTINPAIPATMPPVMDENNPAGFPSIRQLPLLGVRWADLYREAKIQETVFELLTQQYELAKIQEAKEIPTVKILDAPDVPERRAFPKRTLIVIFGCFASLLLGSFWIIGTESWKRINPADIRKSLALEVASTIEARVSRTRQAIHSRANRSIWRTSSPVNGDKGKFSSSSDPARAVSSNHYRSDTEREDDRV
jgi:uncharacterized protein involved in exopolysaccharide biosynthesis